MSVTTLMLPRQRHLQARVEGGIGNTTISIPTGVAVRLAIDARVGSIKFPDAYLQQGDAYVSPGYETAANGIDLTASSGIGNITIKQISE